LPIPLQDDDLLRLKSIGEKVSTEKGSNTDDIDSHEHEECHEWKINASSILTSHDIFQALAGEFLMDELQVDAEFMGVRVQLRNMMLHEQGEHYTSTAERTPGLFARYLLFLPVVSGYTGGAVECEGRRDSEDKIFDFSGEAKKTVHQLLVSSWSSYNLQTVVTGCQVVLRFDLFWGKHRPPKLFFLLDNLHGIHMMARCIEVLKAVGERWNQEGIAEQTMLAIRLQEIYKRKDFGFSSLSRKDALLATAIIACSNLFDVYLTLRTQHVVGVPDDFDEDDDFYHDHYGEKNGYHIIDISEQDYTSKWIHYKDQNKVAASTSTVADESTGNNFASGEESECESLKLFNGHNIIDDDITSEDGLFPDEYGDSPEEQKLNRRKREGITLENWYHRGVLVIIPKKFADEVQIVQNAAQFVKNTVEMIEIPAGGGDDIVLKQPIEDLSNTLKRLDPVLAMLRPAETSQYWLRLLIAALTVGHKKFFERLFDRVGKEGRLPVFTPIAASIGTSSASEITIPNHHQDWDCILYLIKHKDIGWQRAKTLLSGLRANTPSGTHRAFFNLEQLLRSYDFPTEVYHQMVNECIVKDIIGNNMQTLWKSIPKPSQQPAPPSFGDFWSFFWSRPAQIGPQTPVYTAGEYLVDALIFLLQHGFALDVLQKRLGELVTSYEDRHVLQVLLKKIAEGQVTCQDMSLHSLTMLKDLTSKHIKFLQDPNLMTSSWAIPISSTKNLPADLLQFLHSEERGFMKKDCFPSIYDARKYGESYCDLSDYGVHWEAGGTGKKSYVRVTKVSQPHEKRKKEKIAACLTTAQKALQLINNALDNSPKPQEVPVAPSPIMANCDDVHPATKRQKKGKM
jgi:hypothetical protein